MEKPITSLVINVGMANKALIDEVVTAVAVKKKKSIGYSATTVSSETLNKVKKQTY